MRKILLSCLLLPVVAFAGQLEENMVNKINQANRNLAATEKNINQESVRLSKALSKLEQSVLELRNKTAVARRKMDERTLGLTQLESRLDSWKKQQVFQSNLLDRFLQQQGVSYSQLTQLSFNDKLSQVEQNLAQLEQKLIPNWQTSKLILTNGEVTQANVLSVGPVNWFIDTENQIAGLASWQNNLLTAQANLDSNQYDDLQTLLTAQSGELVLDPTLGRAVTKSQAEEGMVEHVVKGGIWVVPILVFALIATIICLFKVAQLWRLPQVVRVNSVNTINTLSASFKGMQLALYNVARQAVNANDRDDQLFMQLQHDKHQLEKWTNTIAITAAVAPLLGLLGTVSGMIETFRMMTSFGSSDPEVISGGIAKALVTTELGLVVAIPALILNAVLSRKAKRYYDDLEGFALVLSNDKSNAQEDAKS
ncbi:MotA/TolQ/ExbB proton channel family protein [Catenovulum sp. 2E275]|uniref:MotA/TolQ/ExbB proton channel family protein n=1 Tax=Catenovulum sp. 2E275 TaxID=2980497 RepID=UPI0021D00DB3|nr:MotA/TolQ/ExbB proton channel family protein [Catenovulum sp. 2E275]MCU4676529.1 MotA/TolQ/ExbB proton channel family protein [Catenovulum sp. 2E275]